MLPACGPRGTRAGVDWPGRSNVDKLLKIVAVTLGVALAVAYVAAKIHFFRFFSHRGFGEYGPYWAEHWPYTAALLVIVALLLAVGAAMQKRVEDER